MNKTLTLFLARRLPFYYGWLMLALTMLVHICTAPGQTYGISVFTPFLREELSLSASRLGGAYMVATLLAGLPLTLVGGLMDRHGARVSLIIIVLLLGVTCGSMSMVSGFWSLFLVFFFLRFLAQGSMGLLAANTQAMWFNRRLGLASGLSNMGMAASFGLIPPLNHLLIENFGWRATYILLGLGVWAILLPLLFLLYRNRPGELGLEIDGGPPDARVAPKRSPATARESTSSFSLPMAMRTRSFWILGVIAASWSMSSTGVQFQMVSILGERGLTAGDAVQVFSVYAAIMAASHPLAGYLADRVPLNLLLFAGTLSLSAGMGIVSAMESRWLAFLFPAALAGGSGLLIAVSETIWVRYYGRTHIGKIRGFVATIGVVASGTGPFALGVSYDLFGDYSPMLWIFCALIGALAAASLFATPPKPPSRSQLRPAPAGVAAEDSHRP